MAKKQQTAGFFSRLFKQKSNGAPYISSDARPARDQSELMEMISRALSGETTLVTDRRSFDLYIKSAALSNVVNKVVNAACQFQPVLFDKEANQFEYDHEVLEIFARPGFGSGFKRYMRELTLSYLLTGHAFFEIGGNIDRPPLFMIPRRPYHVNINSSYEDGFPETYDILVTNAGKRSRKYKRLAETDFRFVDGNFSELIHIMGAAGGDYTRPINPLQSLLSDIESSIYGKKHNSSFLKNGATPSGALFTKDSETFLTEDQIVRLKEELTMQYTGANNAGRPMLLEGGLDWKQFAVSNRDMDFVNLLKTNLDYIASAFNVPLAIINSDNQTFNNYQTALLAFYDEAVKPVVDYIFEAHERALFPRYGLDSARYCITYDKNALESEMPRKMEAIKNMSQAGVFTIDEIRTVAGYEGVEGGDFIYRPSSEIPVASDVYTGDEISPDSRDNAEDAARKRFMKKAKEAGFTKESAATLWSNRKNG